MAALQLALLLLVSYANGKTIAERDPHGALQAAEDAAALASVDAKLKFSGNTRPSLMAAGTAGVASLAAPGGSPDYLTTHNAVVHEVYEELLTIVNDLRSHMSLARKITLGWVVPELRAAVVVIYEQMKTSVNPASYHHLKPWFRLNLNVLHVAYTFAVVGRLISVLAPSLTDQLNDMNVRLFRIHMGLGRTNWARNSGLPSETVNEIAWENDRLVGLLFSSKDIREHYKASDTYCNRIQAEYNVLINYGNTTTPHYEQANWVGDKAMFEWCKLSGMFGVLVVLDWQQHFADYKSGFFQGGKYQQMLALHTLWHWDSLFALTDAVTATADLDSIKRAVDCIKVAPLNMISRFAKSFSALDEASRFLDEKAGLGTAVASSSVSADTSAAAHDMSDHPMHMLQLANAPHDHRMGMVHESTDGGDGDFRYDGDIPELWSSDYYKDRLGKVEAIEATFQRFLEDSASDSSFLQCDDAAAKAECKRAVGLIKGALSHMSQASGATPFVALEMRAQRLVLTLRLARHLLADFMPPGLADSMVASTIEATSISQGLGRTNWARKYGLPPDTVNKIAWQNEKIVGLMFSNKELRGNFQASDSYCNKIQAEYEVLKTYGEVHFHFIGGSSHYYTVPNWLKPLGPMVFNWCKRSGMDGLEMVTDWEAHLANYKMDDKKVMLRTLRVMESQFALYPVKTIALYPVDERLSRQDQWIDKMVSSFNNSLAEL